MNDCPWLSRAAGGLLVLAMACVPVGAQAPATAGPNLVDVIRERVIAVLAPKPGMKVAEIGVGGGWFVTKVAEAIGTDGVVYGTDIDAGTIAALRRKLPGLRQPAGRVDLRLCRDPRDTALDDLPTGHLDAILMIDSLCFDATHPRADNVAYLGRFLRVLRPGGRLIHHMDCRCEVARDALVGQFVDAGFARAETVDVPLDTSLMEPDWSCRTEAERQRHALIAVFRKPGE